MFRDLSEFLTVEPIRLPIRGKEYQFPGEISARSWLLLQRLDAGARRARRDPDYDPAAEMLSDVDQDALMAELFGGTDEQMVEDGCTSSEIQRTFITLMAYHTVGRELAEAVWRGDPGEFVAPNRAARRHPPKSTLSRGSHAGSTDLKAKDQLGRASSSAGS